MFFGNEGAIIEQLKLDKLSIGYRNHLVAEEIHLVIQEGETVVLTGPNGAGKSTLIKTILNGIKALSGSIYFEGTRLDSKPLIRAFKKKIGYVPQGHIKGAVAMTVRESLVLSLWGIRYGYFGRPSQKDYVEVDKFIKKMGLSELADKDCRALSGGQIQRLKIAMALIRNPKIIILDEPTTYLDVATKLSLINWIKEIKNENPKMTLLLVSHDPEFNFELGERTYHLSDRRLHTWDGGVLDDYS